LFPQFNDVTPNMNILSGAGHARGVQDPQQRDHLL